MAAWRAGARTGAAVLLLLLGTRATARPAPPASPDAPPPHKSVYGTLASIDKVESAIVMKSDAGERLAWRFDPKVIAEASRFKSGDAMIVIYRQTAPNEKRVTALAFPGSAATPIYVNTTGGRVVVRSTPAVDGACTRTEGVVTESTIPAGGVAEVLQGCWCCAVPGEGCTPANKSGNGRALLVQCFK
jgi:hypothetical protein